MSLCLGYKQPGVPVRLSALVLDLLPATVERIAASMYMIPNKALAVLRNLESCGMARCDAKKLSSRQRVKMWSAVAGYTEEVLGDLIRKQKPEVVENDKPNTKED